MIIFTLFFNGYASKKDGAMVGATIGAGTAAARLASPYGADLVIGDTLVDYA